MPRLAGGKRSEEHTSELQSLAYIVCRLLLEKKIKYSIYYLYCVDVRSWRAICTTRRLCVVARLSLPRRFTLCVRTCARLCSSLFFFIYWSTPDFYPFPLHGPLPI